MWQIVGARQYRSFFPSAGQGMADDRTMKESARGRVRLRHGYRGLAVAGLCRDRNAGVTGQVGRGRVHASCIEDVR